MADRTADGVRDNAVRRRISAGEWVTCAWLSTSSPYVAEVLSYSGFDAVTVDNQHGMYALDTAVALIQAASAGPAVPMARCSQLDEAEIGKLLDAGAYGIFCPSIDDAEACRRFVEACRYPPEGVRSYGPARALLYGGRRYVERANSIVMTWAMIESETALQNLDEILGVPGLDGVYVGPNDLALSMGQVPRVTGPSDEVKAALLMVKDAAHARGLAAGAYCGTAATAGDLVREGFDLVTPGNDVALLREAACQRLGELRERCPPHAVGA